MKSKTILWVVVIAMMAVAPPAVTLQAQAANPAAKMTISPGQEVKIDGVIVKRDADTLTMVDSRNNDVVVALTDLTEVKEKKSNPFRRAHNFATTQLLRGLKVEVEGRGDNAGRLVASKIRFTQDELATAQVVEARVTPVEGELKQTNARLAENEENAKHMSGQLEELSAISNAARGGAKAAQETADQAMQGLRDANSRITENHTQVNSRISALDDYEVMSNLMVHFKFGSAALTPEAKADLDKFAEDAKNEKGFVLEVDGFASSDGDATYNLALSRKRADAVVQYLVINHQVPLRRIITPFGYGTVNPVADNGTRTGRAENRRVEVKVLVNKGLVEGGKTLSSGQNNR
jgi:outer membrane protein OmpA-like peptidoglycan-associated protein